MQDLQMMSNSRITGLGAYVPARRLTNADLEKMVDTSDEWIIRRTGMKERRICGENEFASDLAIGAVEDLIQRYNVRVDDVEMVIVSTFTPDHFSPSVAALVQGHFGMKAAGAMDMNAACTGFAYAMSIADALIYAGQFKKILVIAAEAVSKVADYTDRNTCILFGDGAAALLLERNVEEGTAGSMMASYFVSDGTLAASVTCTNLSSQLLGREVGKKRLFEQDGRFLYEYVLKTVPTGVNALMKKAGLGLEDITWFVPHSANLRMISALCERIGMPEEKMLVSNEYYGNTSSASIPLAIWKALSEDKVKKGDVMLLYGFGGGLTQGGVIIKW